MPGAADCQFDCVGLIPVLVNEPLILPDIKTGPDAGNIQTMSGLDRFIIGIVLDVLSRVDVAAMVHEMHAIDWHQGFL